MVIALLIAFPVVALVAFVAGVLFGRRNPRKLDAVAALKDRL